MKPLPQLAWSSVADVCSRTLTPVYHALSATLHDDVEQLAQLFADLEASHEREAYFEVSWSRRALQGALFAGAHHCFHHSPLSGTWSLRDFLMLMIPCRHDQHPHYRHERGGAPQSKYAPSLSMNPRVCAHTPLCTEARSATRDHKRRPVDPDHRGDPVRVAAARVRVPDPVPGRGVREPAARADAPGAERRVPAARREAVPARRALAVRGRALVRAAAARAGADVDGHVLAAPVDAPAARAGRGGRKGVCGARTDVLLA